MLSKHQEQAERLDVLRNDQRLRNQASTFAQFAQADADTPKGRFTTHEQSTVIGATAVPKYEGAPNWANDPTGVEPPLGYAIHDLDPSSLEPKPSRTFRRFTGPDLRKADASFFGPKAQPRDDEAEKDTARKAQPEKEGAQEEAEPVKAGLPAIVPSRPMPATWDDLLTTMNNQHAIIDNVGGKTVIASWEPSSLDPTRLMVAFQNKESFLLRYSNRYATTEITTKHGAIIQAEVPLSQWWLTHRHRRQYRGITFWPGKGEVINECLNLWRDTNIVNWGDEEEDEGEE